MIDPALLALYNAAVRSLPAQKAHLLKEVQEELDEAFKKASGRLDRLVNALEANDEAAIGEHLKSYAGSSSTFTSEQSAFFEALQEKFFPAPEGIAVSPLVTDGNLSQLMESLPPVVPAPNTPVTLEQVQTGQTRADIEIPPQSPPASAPVPAVAEPIPAPEVTPAERPRRKR